MSQPVAKFRPPTTKLHGPAYTISCIIKRKLNIIMKHAEVVAYVASWFDGRMIQHHRKLLMNQGRIKSLLDLLTLDVLANKFYLCVSYLRSDKRQRDGQWQVRSKCQNP